MRFLSVICDGMLLTVNEDDPMFESMLYLFLLVNNSSSCLFIILRTQYNVKLFPYQCQENSREHSHIQPLLKILSRFCLLDIILLLAYN